MAKVLFLSQKTIGKNMAGPGVRVYELAKSLAAENDVAILAPKKSELAKKDSIFNLWRHIIRAEVVIVQIFYLKFFWLMLAFLLRKKIVVDAYFPSYLESFEKFYSSAKESGLKNKIDILRTKILMKLGDYFICASDKQRALWLGWLSSLGRVNPKLYGLDKSFNKVISVVPAGIRETAPVQKKKYLRETIKELKGEDRIILWFSGIWPWLDPITAIKAIKLIENKTIKLVFFGMTTVDDFFKDEKKPKLSEAKKLAGDLGLLNNRVFFIDERLPYEDIADVLLDASIGLSLSRNHLETQFAIRGRGLEYIWANLPMVATKGDLLAEIIAKNSLGELIDFENEEQLAKAILNLLNDCDIYNKVKENIKEFARTLYWVKVAEPLQQFCLEPRLTSDRKWFFSLFIDIITLYWQMAYFVLRFK